MPTSLKTLPAPVRGLARKVASGQLTEHDLGQIKTLPPEMFKQFEFVRVLAGCNPKYLDEVVRLAQQSLRWDLSRLPVA